MFDAHRYRGRHRAPSSTAHAGALLPVAAFFAATFVVAPAAHAAPDDVWDRLAECESSGRWDINTGNGYHGGLQFLPATWRGFGGAEFASAAYQATRAEQIIVAERVLAAQGWDAWPACSRRAGVRDADATPRRAAAEPRPAAAPAPRQTPPAAGDTYTVVAGDTLSEIAAAHDTSAAALFDANRDVVEDPDLIYPGETVRLR